MRNVLLFMFAAVVIGCSTDTATDLPPADSAASNKTIKAESNAVPAPESDAIVIDVRSEDEWNSGHVEQAVHIPHTEIAERIGEVTDNKSAKIVVYCAVGGRAETAKTKLEGLGFTNVENAGGYDDVKQRYE